MGRSLVIADGETLKRAKPMAVEFTGLGNAGSRLVTASNGASEVLALSGVTEDTLPCVFGRNSAAGVGTEGVWEFSTAHVFPASALAMSIASVSTADTAAGTGARTCTVVGLDASYVLKSETVSMAGTTPVALSGTWLRLLYAFVASVGSGGSNAGAIIVFNGGTTYEAMGAGNNISTTARWTIPAGKVGILDWWWASHPDFVAAEYKLYTTYNRVTGASDGVFKLVDSMGSIGSQTTPPPLLPQTLAAGTDIKIDIANYGGSTVATARMRIVHKDA